MRIWLRCTALLGSVLSACTLGGQDEVLVASPEAVGVQPIARSIHSASFWNYTGLQIKAGTPYRFTAEGVWHDAWYAAGPKGYPSPNAVMRLWEGGRRVPAAAWFALVCSVDADDKLQQPVLTGVFPDSDPSITFLRGGELTCFANDVEGFYWNNWGAITMAVQRADASR